MSYTSPPIEKVVPEGRERPGRPAPRRHAIMSGGFGLCGNAEACIDAIARSGVKNLTIISNNCGNQGQGLAVLLKTAPGGARDLQLRGRQPRPGRAVHDGHR